MMILEKKQNLGYVYLKKMLFEKLGPVKSYLNLYLTKKFKQPSLALYLIFLFFS